MIQRTFWQEKIRNSWKKTPIAWLSGVRRSGKTTIAKSFADASYFNCDLFSVAEQLKDPEAFYRSIQTSIVIFDEVHQLPDPARVLKIGADEYSHLKILATGSSTLSATQKFRDSLTDRKRTIHLLPVLAQELASFEIHDLKKRLLHGGLPKALLASNKEAEFYAEWLDSFFARDIQELFHVEKRHAFLQCLEFLLRQNGGLLEVTNLAKACGVSRPTVMNYLEILQITHAIYLLRPFHGGGRQELVKQPKIYGFDTGFVTHSLNYDTLRPADCGLLLENLVLESLLALLPAKQIYFWRDKAQHEIDFVLMRSKTRCDTIECKWQLDAFDAKNLRIFRELYPEGDNYLITAQPQTRPLKKKFKELEVTVLNVPDLHGVFENSL